MIEETGTIPSGIPPLDARVGGALAGRLHLLSGAPGTGKSTASFQFIREGLRLGETVAMLTSDRLADVRSHGAHLGLDLEAPLRTGRLVLLRYRPSFSAVLQHAAVPEQMLDDLRRLFLPARPARVVVDTVSPLLCSAPRSDAMMVALADLWEEMGATSLMTCSGDLSAGRVGYDYRLEPLVERAAAVFHLARQDGRHGASHERGTSSVPTYTFHVARARHAVRSTAPVSYSIEAGVGLTDVVRPQRASGTGLERSRRLLVLATADPPCDEILSVPGRDFVVESQQVAPGAAVPDPATEGAAAVLVELRRETIERDLALIRDVSAHPHAVPVIGATRDRLRSSDRARALRAGADEVLSCDTGPAELLERLHAVVRRGRAPLAGDARPAWRQVETLLMQPTEAPHPRTAASVRRRPLDRDGFAQALAAHVAHDQPTQYTVVSLAPVPGGSARLQRASTLRQLATTAIGTMRVAGGDLVAMLDDRVCVYLHGARLRDGASFVERLRERWSAMHPDSLDVESFGYPSDEPLLRVFMTLPDAGGRTSGASSTSRRPA